MSGRLDEIRAAAKAEAVKLTPELMDAALQLLQSPGKVGQVKALQVSIAQLQAEATALERAGEPEAAAETRDILETAVIQLDALNARLRLVADREAWEQTKAALLDSALSLGTRAAIVAIGAL